MLKKVLTQIMLCLGLVECWQSGSLPPLGAAQGLNLERRMGHDYSRFEEFCVPLLAMDHAECLKPGVILKAFSFRL